jgi:hypothetical protein
MIDSWASYHKKAIIEVSKSNSHLQFYVFRWFSSQLEVASYKLVLSLSILFKGFCCALDCSLCILLLVIIYPHKRVTIMLGIPIYPNFN